MDWFDIEKPLWMGIGNPPNDDRVVILVGVTAKVHALPVRYRDGTWFHDNDFYDATKGNGDIVSLEANPRHAYLWGEFPYGVMQTYSTETRLMLEHGTYVEDYSESEHA